ncbi:MAG: hypothetical protein ABFD89_06975 [Bryobacteraceae bacterium]
MMKEMMRSILISLLGNASQANYNPMVVAERAKKIALALAEKLKTIPNEELREDIFCALVGLVADPNENSSNDDVLINKAVQFGTTLNRTAQDAVETEARAALAEAIRQQDEQIARITAAKEKEMQEAEIGPVAGDEEKPDQDPVDEAPAVAIEDQPQTEVIEEIPAVDGGEAKDE